MAKINLFISVYECGNKDRQKELDFCKKKNINSGLFDKVILIDGMLTYEDFFERTKSYPSDINVLSNSDIYFNETINYVHNLKPKEAYALTRHELVNGAIIPFEERHRENGSRAMHSQDVWIFRGEAKGIYGAFYLGQPGCDNRIAYEITRAGYDVWNRSDVIEAVHVHKEDSRNYKIKTQVQKPYYWIPVGEKAQRPHAGLLRKAIR